MKLTNQVRYEFIVRIDKEMEKQLDLKIYAQFHSILDLDVADPFSDDELDFIAEETLKNDNT